MALFALAIGIPGLIYAICSLEPLSHAPTMSARGLAYAIITATPLVSMAAAIFHISALACLVFVIVSLFALFEFTWRNQDLIRELKQEKQAATQS
jgi:hypothetical protein